MKELDYGKGYRYAHDERDAVAAMDCLPPAPRRPQVLPPDRARLREGDQARLDGWEAIKKRGANTAHETGTDCTRQIRWKFFSISRRVSRSMTGRPCGQTVE